MNSDINHPLSRLLKYSRKYRSSIYQAITCSILNKLFDLAPPVLIGAAVDVVVQKQDSIIAKLGVKDVFGQLTVLTILSVIIWGLESLFEYGYERLWRNLAQNIQHDLRLNAYSHIQDLELEYFESRSTGRLLSILNDDINQLERFLDVGANEILQVLTTVVIISGAFFFLSPSTAWMTILPIPVIIWGAIAFQKLLAPRYGDVREKVSLLNGRLANNLTGITTIKSFTTEHYEIQRVRKDSEAYLDSNQKAIALSAAFVPLIRLVILVAFTAILLFGGMEVEKGNLAVGTYSVLVFMTQRLLWPLTRLGQTLDLYQRAMASTARVMDLLDTPITIHSGDTPLALENVKGAIAFNHITFAYHQRQPVIEEFNLEIPAGATIAIVGSTGSGKSTIVKLLLRFYEIQKGSITLDGMDIRKIVLYDLRRAIGLVSQEVFLFHGSVRENIAYGNPHVSDEEIINAAKIAEAHDFIMSLPEEYDTIVGERGQKLSGGQRQRLSIARAILKNPPILILDEATSAVDNDTEAAIARSLTHITENRTTIMIAHRLSTIRHADCIYVLEKGQIVEQGKHEDLVTKGGVYSNLWRVQTGE
ncbi:ABC transporter ATP-binding protein [Cyanobacterium aponinum AL20118]|uniref:ATP-binding cassette domain-containing protein n=2 Tax=Cyanobacterium aponinum TaxID=379064 RepID=A0A844GSE7_9CHRO|nr:ABC transporter ATP-binding protein [Cyanobacterium aponinum]MTF37698.1 ATP-binding cassette domain-containing protein [Cyanobacterium aponinum 0216]PHV63639.1 ABC transporter [Cyanobacterium aponinum IPPAS B-1201]WPF87609.1 ABC transporter ATP-binding protein [Cyanobacterium aponinum AL20115]